MPITNTTVWKISSMKIDFIPLRRAEQKQLVRSAILVKRPTGFFNLLLDYFLLVEWKITDLNFML